MKTFFVGQLVRIKWSLTWPGLSGQEGRIVARISEAQRRYLPEGHTGEWEVAPLCWGGSASPDELGYFFPASEQLEPIEPEGMKPAQWEDCEWRPDGVDNEPIREAVLAGVKNSQGALKRALQYPPRAGLDPPR
jgi:hypothetical protein